MLKERFGGARLHDALIPRERYRPHATVEDRKAWSGLPRDLQAGLVAAGVQHLGRDWPPLPATLFMEFRRDGNRSRYEARHFERRGALASLVVAECVEAQGRFLDTIADGIWALCEESFWGVPAHNGPPGPAGPALPDTAQPYIDLFAAETAGLLSWTHYLLASRLDLVSPVIGDRVRREVKARILDPYLARDDFWWMGLAPPASPEAPARVNNWNPWCNSNCLAAFLLLEEDPERRLAAVAKALASLDVFLASYHSDGGCDEGTSYWDRAGGSLFDCLELLHSATGGAVDVYAEPLVADMGRYLYRAFIGSNDWYINFADGGARVSISADLVFRYGRRIGDPLLMRLGATAYRHQREAGRLSGVPGSLLRVLPALFNRAELGRAPGDPPYVRDTWLDGIQVMAARQHEGTADGLFVAAKGGHNDESHNHNDVGQFIVYCGAEPVLIDVGVETYSARTFSSLRYEIWTMQSAYHNLPTVKGIQQAPGAEFASREVSYAADDSGAELSLDIACAYPPEAGIEHWQRTIRLERGDQPAVTVRDLFELNAAGDVTLSLMTPRQPRIAADGAFVLPGTQAVRLEYPVEELAAVLEPIDIEDARLRAVWGQRIYRITLMSISDVSSGDWTVRLSVV